MDGDEKKEILEAISALKTEIAVLRTKQENTENYIFKELKVNIERLCNKLEARFKWTIGLIILFILTNIGINIAL